MKKKGSIIADEIIQEWKREAYLKELFIRKRLLKNKWKKKLQEEEERNILDEL